MHYSYLSGICMQGHRILRIDCVGIIYILIIEKYYMKKNFSSVYKSGVIFIQVFRTLAIKFEELFLLYIMINML